MTSSSPYLNAPRHHLPSRLAPGSVAEVFSSLPTVITIIIVVRRRRSLIVVRRIGCVVTRIGLAVVVAVLAVIDRRFVIVPRSGIGRLAVVRARILVGRSLIVGAGILIRGRLIVRSHLVIRRPVAGIEVLVGRRRLVAIARRRWWGAVRIVRRALDTLFELCLQRLKFGRRIGQVQHARALQAGTDFVAGQAVAAAVAHHFRRRVVAGRRNGGGGRNKQYGSQTGKSRTDHRILTANEYPGILNDFPGRSWPYE